MWCQICQWLVLGGGLQPLGVEREICFSSFFLYGWMGENVLA